MCNNYKVANYGHVKTYVFTRTTAHNDISHCSATI